MIRFTFTPEYLTDLLTRSGQAIIMTEGGLDGQHNELLSVDIDQSTGHVIMMFSDGSDDITDRTITFTAPVI